MTIERRLAKIESALQDQEPGQQLDIGSRILAARRGEITRPRRTRELLERLAKAPGLIGRIARADLRLMRFGNSTAPIENPEQEIAAMAGELYADPLGFVLWAYAWDDPALQIVPLPAAYQLTYHSTHGPDLWACQFLEQVGREVAQRGFDGAHAVDALRFATASGHGIGKSTLTAWLVGWIMSTRPSAKGVVTANTSTQLASKTWPEIVRWAQRSLTAPWFDWTTGKGAMRLAQRDAPESWRVDAQTCAAENSEAFAGLHAANSTPFLIFDEASAVPPQIWEVGEGAMTDGEPHFYCFGNPTRNDGAFYQCFHGQRHRWITRQIDSRSVAITNKQLIEQWAEDYGEDSDFFKVRVRGLFPNASSLQFIARSLVDEAQRREIPDVRGEATVVGVDVARFGSDESVIFTRTGRDARSFDPIRLREVDTMQLAAAVAQHINLLRQAGRHVIVNIDGTGVGGGVVDRLRALGYGQCVNEIQFAAKAGDSKQYANRRCEMWGNLREWLKGGCIPQSEALAADLTGPEHGYNIRDQIQLESKDSMRSRGLASPDLADALALTLAHPTPVAEAVDPVMCWDRPVKQKPSREFDPIKRFEREMRDLA